MFSQTTLQKFHFMSCCEPPEGIPSRSLRLNNSNTKSQSHIFPLKHRKPFSHQHFLIFLVVAVGREGMGKKVGKHTTTVPKGREKAGKEKRCGNKIKTEILFPHLHLKSSERLALKKRKTKSHSYGTLRSKDFPFAAKRMNTKGRGETAKLPLP